MNYYGNEKYFTDKGIDSDLYYAFEYNPGQAFPLDEIKNVLAVVFGENDGADWYWIVKLQSGKYGYIQAGCDYTGWDCQSSCSSKILDTRKEALEQAPEKEKYYDRGNIRLILKKQLQGKLPRGVNDLSKQPIQRY